MQQPTINALLLLALAAPLPASPLPRRDVTVRYTTNYLNTPTPRSPSPSPSSPDIDALEADLAIRPTPTGDELDDILSIPKPLPSSFLLSLSKLRGERGEEGEGEGADGAKETETARVAPEARGVGEERSAFVSDARHLCPFAGLVVFWTMGFLACAIQRWRKPRGEIYLDVEKPQRRSLSLRAEGEVSGAN